MLNWRPQNHRGAASRRFLIGCGALIAVFVIYVGYQMWWMSRPSVPVPRERLVIPDSEGALLLRFNKENQGLKLFFQSLMRTVQENLRTERQKRSLAFYSRIGKGDPARGMISLLPIEAGYVAYYDPNTERHHFYLAVSISKYANIQRSQFKSQAKRYRKQKPEGYESYKGYDLIFFQDDSGNEFARTMVENTDISSDSLALLKRAVDRISSEQTALTASEKIRSLYSSLDPDSLALVVVDNSKNWLEHIIESACESAPEELENVKEKLLGFVSRLESVACSFDLISADEIEGKLLLTTRERSSISEVGKTLSMLAGLLEAKGVKLQISPLIDGTRLATSVNLSGFEKFVVEFIQRKMEEESEPAGAPPPPKEQTTPTPPRNQERSPESPKEE